MDADDLWDPFDCQSTQGPVHDGDYFDAAGFCFSDDEDDEEFGGIAQGLHAHISVFSPCSVQLQPCGQENQRRRSSVVRFTVGLQRYRMLVCSFYVFKVPYILGSAMRSRGGLICPGII